MEWYKVFKVAQVFKNLWHFVKISENNYFLGATSRYILFFPSRFAIDAFLIALDSLATFVCRIIITL